MQQQKNIQTQDWMVFMALSIVWGFSFFFIKKGFSPLQVAAFRMCFAFVVFIPFIVLYRKKLHIDRKK